MANPLYEKYRPKTWNDLYGEIAKKYQKSLSGSLLNNDLCHLLLHGPPGTGKNSFVFLLLQELAIKYKIPKIEKFTTFLNAGKNRGIDMIRTTIKELAQKKCIRVVLENNIEKTIPHFIIFDEADKLTDDAQYALRRSMEEYIRTCRFIFSCNSINKILTAIQSRTNVIFFPPLKKEMIIEILVHVQKEEKKNSIQMKMQNENNEKKEIIELEMNPNIIEQIANSSHGDMRTAFNNFQLAQVLLTNSNEEFELNHLCPTIYPEEVEEEKKKIIRFQKIIK